MRYNRRTDKNLTEVVQELRNLGWKVHVANGVGHDLLCRRGNIGRMVEVKNPAAPWKLTTAEEIYQEYLRGVYRVIEYAAELK